MSIQLLHLNNYQSCFIRGCMTSAYDEIVSFDIFSQKNVRVPCCPNHIHNARNQFICNGYFDKTCGKKSRGVNSKCYNCARNYAVAMRQNKCNID